MRKSGGVDPQLLRAGAVLTCSAVGGAFDLELCLGAAGFGCSRWSGFAITEEPQ